VKHFKNINIMNPKRIISILLPIKINGEVISVFMQKRSAGMKVLPNYFGFWGGGCENDETPEQGLIREVKEELGLDLDINSVKLFNHYEFLGSIKNVYLLYPPDGWEKAHVIGEGDFGQWFLLEDALNRKDIIFEDKVVLNDLERDLLKKPIR
jgi:8-oxo-dGTP diphosphatase